jgi:hypothetical protein
LSFTESDKKGGSIDVNKWKRSEDMTADGNNNNNNTVMERSDMMVDEVMNK